PTRNGYSTAPGPAKDGFGPDGRKKLNPATVAKGVPFRNPNAPWHPLRFPSSPGIVGLKVQPALPAVVTLGTATVTGSEPHTELPKPAKLQSAKFTSSS